MSITAKKITATRVLKGTIPSDALPVISKDFNLLVDDVTTLDTRTANITPTTTATDAITAATAAGAISISTPFYKNTLTALDSTGTITAAILKTGGITSTSAAGVTATIDSVANLVTAFGATTGTVIDFLVLNPGSNTVTVAVPSGMVVAKQVSSGDTAVSALLTVAASATIGSAGFKIVFLSATAAVLHRIF